MSTEEEAAVHRSLIKHIIEYAQQHGIHQTLECFMTAMGLLGERVSLQWKAAAPKKAGRKAS